MLKRCSVFIISILMMAGAARGADQPRLDLGSVQVDTSALSATIAITLTNVAGVDVGATSVDIGYDTALLGNPTEEMIVVGPAGLAAGKDVVHPALVSPGLLRVGVIGFNTTKIGDGVVVTISFPIKGVAGVATLTNLPSATTPFGDDVAVTGANGAITITTPVVKGNITSSATALHFGNVTVGNSSPAQILTFTNSGPGSLTVSSAPTNGNDTDFLIESGGPTPCPELPHTFASGEGCTLTVTFAPTTGGTRSATMSVISDAANSPTLNVSMDGNGRYSLTAVITGSGSGSVNSTPAGIACGSGSCSAPYDAATPVSLMATPANYSTFDGWTGGCGSIDASGNCVIAALNANTTITATFTLMPPLVQVTGDTTPYQSLLGAYLAAADGTVLTARNMTFDENLDLSHPIGFTLKGGRDAGFSTANGFTYLHGVLTVRSGKLTAEYLAVK